MIEILNPYNFETIFVNKSLLSTSDSLVMQPDDNTGKLGDSPLSKIQYNLQLKLYRELSCPSSFLIKKLKNPHADRSQYSRKLPSQRLHLLITRDGAAH